MFWSRPPNPSFHGNFQTKPQSDPYKASGHILWLLFLPYVFRNYALATRRRLDLAEPQAMPAAVVLATHSRASVSEQWPCLASW